MNGVLYYSVLDRADTEMKLRPAMQLLASFT